MNIILAILIFITSLALIIFGGNKLVDSAVAIAKRFKISTAVIGATIVSIGTTIPELLVSIFSVSSGASNLAVGNAFGSIIFNTCVIGGLLLCFCKIIIKQGWNYEYLLLMGILIIIFMLSLGGNLGIASSILLLFVFVAFMLLNFFKAKKSENKMHN